MYEDEDHEEEEEAMMPRKTQVNNTIMLATQSTSEIDIRNEQETGKNAEDGREGIGHAETLAIAETISTALASSSKCDVKREQNVKAGREKEQEEAMAIDE